MLIYRNSRDWARFFEPAVLLGVYTPDEMMELAEGAKANRAREISERPSLMQRLQDSQQEPQETREGFDADFVQRETDSLSAPAENPIDEPSEASPRTDVESGTGSPAPSDGPALDHSDDEHGRHDDGDHGDLPEGDAPADNSPPAADARMRNSMQECLDKFLFAATNPSLPDDRARQDSIIFTKNVWKDELKDRQDFVKACTDTANKVLKGQMTKDAARAELSRWLP